MNDEEADTTIREYIIVNLRLETLIVSNWMSMIIRRISRIYR